MSDLNNFGLSAKTMDQFLTIFEKYPAVRQVKIFGSRVLNRYKPGSDVDLALWIDHDTDKTLLSIDDDLDESLIPYFVDLVDYEKISNVKLKDQIDKYGEIFYSRKKPD